jgi:beta-lactamase regulating signal transducer with metallopeptidase domain
MLYGTALAAVFALAALIVEYACSALRRPRRNVWIVAIASSLLAPPMLIAVNSDRVEVGSASLSSSPSIAQTLAKGWTDAGAVVAQTTEPAQLVMARPMFPELNSLLAVAWIIASSTLAAFYLLGWMSVHRRLRQWRSELIAGRRIAYSEDVGPAVFGFLQPTIIVPGWLEQAPAAFRSLALEHERQHLANRDQLALLAGLIAIVIAPWNLPLWWQLRRLRFAIEVDCDGRVLQSAVDPLAYGEMLLHIGRRAHPAPASAIAVTQRPSDLERRIRIMISSRQRHAAATAVACVALCVSLVAAATQIDPPAMTQPALRLAPPHADLAAHIQHIVRDRYPQLFESPDTQPALVEIVLNDDLSINWSRVKALPVGTSQEDIEKRELPGKALQEHLHVDEPRSSGRLVMLRGIGRPPVFVAFAVRVPPTSGDPVARTAEQSQRATTQRALIERYFPEIANGASNPHELLWVLLDSRGDVIATGHEASNPETLLVNLEQRNRGAANALSVTRALSDIFDRQMLDERGQPILATFAWLADEERSRSATPSSMPNVSLDLTVRRNGELLSRTPLSLTPGKPQIHTEQNVRLDISAVDASDSLVDIGIVMRVPIDTHSVDFAPRWEVVSRPMMRVHFGEEAVLEQGVHYPGEAGGDVVWRIGLMPTRAD